VRIFVIIATLGRAAIVWRTVADIALQTRLPDGIVVVGTKAADTEGVTCANAPIEVVYANIGLCSQRNRGLEAIAGRADVVLFLDDDFVMASDYIARLEEIFAKHSEVVGCTGRIVADGIHGPGFSFEDAYRFIAEAPQPQNEQLATMESLYGCNMAFRVSAISGMRFDENLPLYGWQEDADFTYRLGERGTLVKSQIVSGVHLGAKVSRSPGRRLGYSQIANPIYLVRKKTLPRKAAWKLMSQNFAANLLKAFLSDDLVDRRGRLLGNLLALRDWLFGSIDPRRILEFN
jgi:GT2 family glycosyltransferase